MGALDNVDEALLKGVVMVTFLKQDGMSKHPWFCIIR
ncbi:MAG: hypothetical protein ACI9RO_000559 [Alteromonas macleodii]|jgi:hypothetical protein